MQKRLVVLAVLLFCSVASQNALASSGIGLRSIGANVGLVDPENISGTLGLGAFANLGNISPDIRLAPQIGYWSKSEDFAGDKTTISDISVATRGEYMFHMSSPKFQPYAGAGLGVHFVHVKATSSFPSPMTVSDTRTKLGVDFGGGFSTPLSQKTDFTLDVWYTAVSDVGQLSVKAGMSFDLPGGSSHAESRAKSGHKRSPRR